MKNVISNLTVLLFGLYGLKLHLASRLTYYINSKYIPFFIGTSVICIIVGSLGIFVALFKTKNIPTKSSITLRSILFYMPLIILLSLGFIFKPKSLSFSYAFQQPKQISYNGFSLRDKYKFPNNKIDYTFNDWFISIETSENPRKIHNDPVKIVGFVYKKNDYRNDVFLLSRYTITCCAVDASPIGFPVRADSATIFENGTWVQVTGVWTIMKDRNNQERLFIIPTNISKTDEPDQPYVLSIDSYNFL